MKGYWELFKKELRATSFSMLIVSLLSFAWVLFLYYKKIGWSTENSFGLSFIPLLFFTMIPLWMGFQSFRQEWKDDTIYQLLLLPRRGVELSSVKLLVGMIFYIGISSSLLGMIFFFYQGYMREEVIIDVGSMGLLLNYTIKIMLGYWAFGFGLYVLSQFSYIVSKFFDKFSWLVVILVFKLGEYVIVRGAGFLAPLFSWFPKASLDVMTGNLQTVMNFDMSVVIASMVIVVLIFLTSSWLLEKHLEV